MMEKIRVRCPICGMMPELERVKEKPVYQIEAYLQRFGGRLPSKPESEPIKPKRGPKPRRGIGFMEYNKLDDPKLIDEARKLFLEHIERAKSEGIL